MNVVAFRIVFSVTLSLLALIFYTNFFEFSASFLKPHSVLFDSENLAKNSQDKFIFAINIGLLPFLYSAILKWTAAVKLRDLIILLTIPMLTGGLFWYFRILFLKSDAADVTTYHTLNGTEKYLLSSQLAIEKFLLLGFAFGLILMLVIFKLRNRKRTE